MKIQVDYEVENIYGKALIFLLFNIYKKNQD